MSTSVDYLIKVLADTSDADKKLGGFGKKAQGALMGAGVVAAGALAAGFVAALDNAINIDATNDKIASQLGLTEAESGRAGEAAAAAYSNAFGDSMETVQHATAGVISSIEGMRDASVDELQGITEKVLTLSDGFELEADRISQITGQMISTGLASSAEEGLDLLTASLQKVPAAVRGDILDAVDEYGPFFNQLGISGEEAMSSLVAASEKGMFGIDKTGDALKEFTIRATDMSTASGAAFEEMGLDQEEYTNMLLAGGEQASDAFNTIVLGLKRIEDPAAQSQAALALFGTPLEDLNVGEIPAFLDSLQGVQGGLGETEGAAQAMADTMGGNAATSWETFLRTIEMVSTEIASTLLPVLQPMLAWIAENTWVVGALAAIIGVVLVAAFIAWTASIWAANVALFANPITWIILAIVALIAALVLLVMNWDQVVAWVSDVWAGFIGWITSVTDGLVSWWNGVWTGFASWIKGVWQGFTGWIRNVFQGFAFWLINTGNNISRWWTNLWSSIGNFVRNAWNNLIVSPIRTAVQWMTDSIRNGLNLIRNVWSSVWNGLTSVVRNVFNGVLGSIENGVNGAIGLINNLIGAINSVTSTIGITVGTLPGIDLPRLAEGGVTSGPTLALIGDNPGGREVVEPLSSYEARLDRAFEAGARNGGGGGDVNIIVTQKVAGISLDELIDIRIEKNGRARRVAIESGSRRR